MIYIYLDTLRFEWPVLRFEPRVGYKFFVSCHQLLLCDEWVKIVLSHREYMEAMTAPDASMYQRYPPLPSGQRPRADIEVAWSAIRYTLDLAHETFTCRDVLLQKSRESCMRLVRKIGAEKTRNDAETRIYLGNSLDVWYAYERTFGSGIQELKAQCYLPKEALQAPDPPCWAKFMVARYTTIRQDCDVLSDFLLIAQQMLMNPGPPQDYLAQSAFDRQVLQLMEFCIRVIVRGYDGEQGLPMEEAYGSIIDGIKKVLIRCLLVLLNLVQQNDNRYLQLWLDLFCDQTKKSLGYSRIGPDIESMNEGITVPLPGRTTTKVANAWVQQEGIQVPAPLSATAVPSHADGLAPAQATTVDYESLGANSDALKHAKPTTPKPLQHPDSDGTGATAPAPAAKNPGAKQGEKMPITGSQASGEDRSGEDELEQEDEATEHEAIYRLFNPERHEQLSRIQPMDIAETAKLYVGAKRALVAHMHLQFPELDDAEDEAFGSTSDEDLVRQVDIPDSIRLDFAKLFPETAQDANLEFEQEEYDEENDLDVEDYCGDLPKPRGIMAELPLVVAPGELDAIAHIISGGINWIPNPARMSKHKVAMQNMRCHMLLNQTPGRQLLKEMLVFLAAWEIKEDDKYFLGMLNIVHAILQHGLLPYAYHALSDPKDVVSPAQNALLKCLHHVFIYKLKGGPPNFVPRPTDTTAMLPAYLTMDLHTIRHLLAVFRQDIVPPVLAIVWLQGRVFAGAVPAVEFPVQLWDMERVYEGVYTFFDVLAVLNEVPMWKAFPIQHQLAHDVLQIIAYLDENIPKVPIDPAGSTAYHGYGTNPAEGYPGVPDALTPNTAPMSAAALAPDAPAAASTPPASMLVERPYDPAPSVPDPPTASAGAAAAAASIADPPPTASQPPLPPPPQTQAPHPSFATNNVSAAHAFPWQNLKKSCLITLSNLLHGAPAALRRQVRALDAVPLLLRCAAGTDAHNPGVKDHAVLCLKMLWEGESATAAGEAGSEAGEQGE